MKETMEKETVEKEVSKKEITMKKVYIRTTNECNLNCSFCYQKEKHGKDHMTLETFDKILGRLDLENDSICLYGGEALLNREVFNKAMNSSIKKLNLITNASVLLTENEIKKFNQIQLSYNEGLFEDNIIIMAERCIKNNVNFVINLVFDESTIDKIIDFEYMNEELLEYFTFSLNTEKQVPDYVVQLYSEMKRRSIEALLKRGDKTAVQWLEKVFSNSIHSKLQQKKSLCSDRGGKERIDFDHNGNQSFCESCSSSEPKDFLKESCDYCPVECNIQLCKADTLKRTSEIKCKNFRVDYHINLSTYLKYLRGEI